MRWGRWIGIAVLAASFAGFANPLPARAEAGSIGGAIGKQNKSISGGEDANTPASHAKLPAAAKEATSGRSCGRIVGRWSWYLQLSESTFHKDGTAVHSGGTTGKWSCAGDTVKVSWSNGITDHITVSQDGNGIFVDSPWGGGIKFTGKRRAQE